MAAASPPPTSAPPAYKPSGKSSGATAAPVLAAKGVEAAKAGLFEGVANMIPDNDNWKWYYWVLGGLAMVPCAFMEFFRLLDYEQNKTSDTGLKNFESFVYGIFGKWGVCGFTVLIGAFCIIIGIAKWQKEKRLAAAAA